MASEPDLLLLEKFGSDGLVRYLRLLTHAAKFRPRGVFYDMNDLDLAFAMGCTSDEMQRCPKETLAYAQNIKAHMLESKMLENDPETGFLRIHQWEEHNGYAFHAPERSKSARRGAKARWRKKLRKHAKNDTAHMPDD